MPLYEYLCEDCGHRFDMMRSMKDSDAVAVCKNCQSEHTRRLLSVFFASSEGRSVTHQSSEGCGGCSGGSCGSCGGSCGH